LKIPQSMTTLSEACQIVLNSVPWPSVEQINFSHSLNRILADDIISDTDIPSFNRSAVDGYACRQQDAGCELEVMETIPAGKEPQKIIYEGQCSKIMTGAMIPEGADCVLMVEDTIITRDNRIRFTGSVVTSNIRFRGEEVKKGQVVLFKGTRIRPQEIAVMAAVGCISPFVSRQVKTGIISNGDELVEPYFEPGCSKIRNSNAWQLMAQVTETGALPFYCGIAEDDEVSTIQVIERALISNDTIIITGGVSMGDYDYVPAILHKAGFRILINSISIQPGRPTVFAVRENKFIFGLPGNPVSSFVIFELLVKPFLFRMMGHDFTPQTTRLELKDGFKRKKTDREKWIPVKHTSNYLAEIVEYHGSAHIHALTDADGLICIPAGVSEIKPGETVNVRQI